VATFVFFAVAVWVWAAAQRRQFHDEKFAVWGILVLALGLASGAVFEFGVRCRASVHQVQPVPWRPIVRLTVGVSSAAVALTLLNFAFERSAGTTRGVLLTILAIVGGGPAVVAQLGIARAILITGRFQPGENARRLDAYLELRSLSLRLLAALGSLVALTTFALGAARQAAPVGTESALPVEALIAYGAVGTALVGMVYAIPNQALREEARALVHLLTPLVSAEAAALRKELDERQRLEGQLGLNASLLGDLQAGLVVFGPLLAASITLFLPSR
jgi:hypothetical protein